MRGLSRRNAAKARHIDGAGLAAILTAAWPGPREAITAFHQFVAFGKGLRHIGEPPAYLAGQGTDAGVAQG